MPTDEQKGPYRLMAKIPRSADQDYCTSTGSKEANVLLIFFLYPIIDSPTMYDVQQKTEAA